MEYTTLDIDGDKFCISSRDTENGEPISKYAFGASIATVKKNWEELFGELSPVVLRDLDPCLEPIANGEFVGIATPKSGNIDYIGYDHIKHTLMVTFKRGKSYHYFDVPQSMWQRFLTSESKGKFLNANIKNIFEYKAVEEKAP